MSQFPSHTVLGVEDFKELTDDEYFICGNVMYKKSKSKGIVVAHRAKKNQEGTEQDFNEDDLINKVRLTGV